ncbi:MAG: aromatic ring-hydroxylating dioxygenase subunit alpha [Bacteroidetes bacterium]|nr:aromatic ring-hydroxylating dioxygenase subunit alpha [Bacteroidota bacterium]
MTIEENIRKASTLPGAFYRDKAVFETVKEKIFAATWHYVADAGVVKNPGDVHPFTLLPGVLDEPLVLARDREGHLRCLSNVCTHRGKIIVEQPGNLGMLRCGYHGRCFRLDGSFKSMPEFQQAENFPTKDDDLTQVPVHQWLGMIFVSLQPTFDFEEATRPIRERIGFLPLEQLRFHEEGTQDYFVAANWTLYCDNFLEGFHIPFVHPALNQALDFGQYGYQLFRYCNLQVGIAEDGQPHFDILPDQPDFGKKIYAWYFWLFPNLMLNFYPWGLSLNVVEPLGHDRTRIAFRTYRFENQPFNRGENQLEKTEFEDEAVVESVQRGIQSRFYRQGRFSPTMEQGVHHFHRLVAEFLDSFDC